MGSFGYITPDLSNENLHLDHQLVMSGHLGSTHSSPSSFDDDAHMIAPSNWSNMPPPMSTAPSSATSSAPNKGSLPLQKRRRVTRACDECRRKKIKCDGKQPCTHCTVYSYDCSYDQPSNRRRNPAPQYIEALENRLQRMEALLKAILPDVDVSNADFDPTKLLPEIQAAATAQVEKAVNEMQIGGTTTTSGSSSVDTSGRSTEEKDSLLESMVEAAGRLDIDESGYADFHGQSSSLSFLAHLNKHFGGILGEVKLGSSVFPAPKVGDSPQGSTKSSPTLENLPDISTLPSHDVARKLAETCLEDACIMMRFIHAPSFFKMLDRVYEFNPENYDSKLNAFIPLLYLTLGVGCLFVTNTKELGISNPVQEAFKYFNTGRRMIEMTDIRDLFSLQAVVLMVLFLQHSARMSTCYSYLGIAMSAALRMGLHRSLPETKFNHIEREVRRRLFWTIWKMDVHVSALLGLPKGISDEDIDQDMPEEVDDDRIRCSGISRMPEGQLSAMVAANAHTRLMRVMAKVVKYIYPLKGIEASVTGSRSGYKISESKLHEIEGDLAAWFDRLPMRLRPGDDTSGQFLKAQFLLKISFAHVQMMLYRPFVHYVAKPRTKGCDEKPYAIAAACVNVARKICHVTDEMRSKGILNGAYWFTMYTTFFSVITLVYYVLVTPPDTTSLAILGDANAGRECLATVQENSLAARRCTVALQPLFEKIPEKVSRELEQAVASKKKRANDDDDMEGQSPRSQAHSSPGKSPEGSSTASLPRRKTLPASPATAEKRKSLNNKNWRASLQAAQNLSNPLNRRISYELYNTADMADQKPQLITQPSPYQAHLSGSGLPDLNAMMFPSPQQMTFPHHQSNDQSRQSSQELQSPGLFVPGNQFDSLEGNLFGPLPPYLLQGDQQMMGDYPEVMPNEQPLTSGPEIKSEWQYYPPNQGSSDMIPGFFRDEWDESLMRQSFAA